MSSYSFPPEKPQDHLEYFRAVARLQPAVQKWLEGVKAAELWVAYHESSPRSPEILNAIIRILMPFRWAGSGFYALWGEITGAFVELPVRQQIDLWRTVFNPAHHGELLLPNIKQAQAILDQWEKSAKQHEQDACHPPDAASLIQLFGQQFQLKVEWLVFARAVDSWLVSQGSRADLFSKVMNQIPRIESLD